MRVVYNNHPLEEEIYCSTARYIHSFRPAHCIKWVAINQLGNVLGLWSVPCFREPKDVLQSPSSWGQRHCSGKWLFPKIKPHGSKLNPRNNSKIILMLWNGPGPAPRNTPLTKALQEVSTHCPAWWVPAFLPLFLSMGRNPGDTGSNSAQAKRQISITWRLLSRKGELNHKTYFFE